MGKMIQNAVKKAAKKSAQTYEPMAHCLSQVKDLKVQIEANQKKRKTLASMCQILLSKNTELYLRHEQMLEEERKKRAELGITFQQQMAVIQDELNTEKERRAS